MVNRNKITRDTPMPFGKHKGTPLSEVDLGYLKWYRDAGEIEDWVEACEREIKYRKNNDDERPADKPQSKAAAAIPLQSDHMVVSLALIEENYRLVQLSLGREAECETAQAHTDTIFIALSRNSTIDWALVEQEQRRLHKDLTSK